MRVASVVLVSLWALAGNARAQDSAPPRKLIVATRHVPPFAIKQADGQWTGIAIELWRDIAMELKLEFELRDMELDDMLAALRDGKVDAAVAALTVTAEREEQFDFTHPFYTTGLGIAVVPQAKSGWMSVLERIISWQFARVILVLVVLLFAVGALVWLFERRRNRQQFGGNAISGLGSAFWWSAVTMTTVGYGDKTPATVAGRLVALVWMFAAIILISFFTAMITSALTVTQLESRIGGPQDLADQRVATVANSTSQRYLTDNHIVHVGFETADAALQAVADGDADAAVYDAPVLRYLVNQRHRGVLAVLAQTFQRQDYAIALPNASPLRDRINRILVERIRSAQWQDLLFRYLGAGDE